jgi:hypothetical protein
MAAWHACAAESVTNAGASGAASGQLPGLGVGVGVPPADENTSSVDSAAASPDRVRSPFTALPQPRSVTLVKSAGAVQRKLNSMVLRKSACLGVMWVISSRRRRR